MKRILVMSDTHGNQVFLRQVCLSEEFDLIFHLGDDYSDLDHNPDISEIMQVYRVPGIMNDTGQKEIVPMILHVTVDNWQFQLVHRQEDIDNTFSNDHVILYGHTHHPFFQFRDGILYANPGHLKSSHHRNHQASYLVITLDEDKMTLVWKDISGKTFDQHKLTRNNWFK